MHFALTTTYDMIASLSCERHIAIVAEPVHAVNFVDSLYFRLPACYLANDSSL